MLPLSQTISISICIHGSLWKHFSSIFLFQALNSLHLLIKIVFVMNVILIPSSANHFPKKVENNQNGCSILLYRSLQQTPL